MQRGYRALTRRARRDGLAGLQSLSPLGGLIRRGGPVGRAFLEGLCRVLGEDAYAQMYGSAWPVMEELRTLCVPTLIVVGAEDTWYLERSAALAQLVPRAEHVVIPKAGHFCNIEQPARFNAVVGGFLGKHVSLKTTRSRGQ